MRKLFLEKNTQIIKERERDFEMIRIDLLDMIELI